MEGNIQFTNNQENKLEKYKKFFKQLFFCLFIYTSVLAIGSVGYYFYLLIVNPDVGPLFATLLLFGFIWVGGFVVVLLGFIAIYFFPWLKSKFIQRKNSSDNSDYYSQDSNDDRKINASSFIWPIFAIILLGLYFTKFDIFVFWHPILTSLIKVIYFPIFIFPENFLNDIFGSLVPNPITIGIAIFLSLSWVYFLCTFFIFLTKKINLKWNGLIGVVITTFVLIAISYVFTNAENSKCVLVKENNRNRAERQGIVSILFEDEYLEINKIPSLFYSANGISYLYETTFETEPEKEIKTACRLENYPSISSVWPTHHDLSFGAPAFEERRDMICKALGFSPNSIKDCLEFILKDSETAKKLGDYEIDENGK